MPHAGTAGVTVTPTGQGAPPTVAARTARQLIRDRTREAHRRTERAVLPDAWTPATYRRTLEVFLGLFEPAEAALRACPPVGPDGPLVPSRRAHLAVQDLRTLGATDGDLDALPRAEVATPASPAEALGVAYVLEGSGRGAAVLARQVHEALPGAPTAFLGGVDPAAWTSVVRALEAVDATSIAAAEAVAAAGATFRALLQVARP